MRKQNSVSQTEGCLSDGYRIETLVLTAASELRCGCEDRGSISVPLLV